MEKHRKNYKLMKIIIITGYFFLLIPFISLSQEVTYQSDSTIKHQKSQITYAHSKHNDKLLNNKTALLFKRVINRSIRGDYSHNNKNYENVNQDYLTTTYSIDNASSYKHKKTFSLFKSNIIIFVLAVILIVIIILIVLIIRAKAQIKKSQKELEKKEKRLLEIQKKSALLKKKIDNISDELTHLVETNDSSFQTKFQEVYPTFIHNLLQKYPKLNNGELIFCEMLFLNFSSKQIAEYTHVKHRSIQTRKNRLRKKMKLDQEVNLYHYLKTFA